MGYPKHSPKFIKNHTGNKPAMVVSMPNTADVGYKTAEEVLSSEITATENVANKTVAIQIFGKTEVVPSEARIQEILARLDACLPREEYGNIEAQQIARFDKSLEAVDLKDLDTKAFMDYWSQAAKIADLEKVQTRCENLESENVEQKTLIDGLTAELAKRPHSQRRLRVHELLKDENGNSYFEVVPPRGLKLHDATIFADGIALFYYNVSPATGRITFDGEIAAADVYGTFLFSGTELPLKFESYVSPESSMTFAGYRADADVEINGSKQTIKFSDKYSIGVIDMTYDKEGLKLINNSDIDMPYIVTFSSF
jgi:hypothetical protein